MPETGGEAEDRLRHRWRLLEIAERTGRTPEEVARRRGLRLPEGPMIREEPGGGKPTA